MTNSKSILAGTGLRCSCRVSDESLRQWVTSHFSLVSPSAHLVDNTPDVVIYDDNYRKFIREHADAGSNVIPRVVLCLTGECDDSYLDLYSLNVRHIIYPKSPFASDALCLAIVPASVEALGDSEGAGAVDTQIHVIRTIEDYYGLAQKLESFLQLNDFSQFVGSAQMVMREALTNAVFHSFREKGSHSRKYSPETFLGFYDSDNVNVTFEASKDWFSIAVNDNSGSLGPLSIMNSLDRHRSELGKHDMRGRGFFIMRHVSHRMIICIRRGSATVVKLYFLRDAPQTFCRHVELVEI